LVPSLETQNKEKEMHAYVDGGTRLAWPTPGSDDSERVENPPTKFADDEPDAGTRVDTILLHRGMVTAARASFLRGKWPASTPVPPSPDPWCGDW
jgi:hypothetical protein